MNNTVVDMAYNNEIVADITFEKVANNYIEEQQLTLRPNSINKYIFLLEKHILPELGKVVFQQINHEQIKMFLDHKASDGRLDHSGGLSDNTLNDILVLIKSIIIYGENKYNLHINLGKFQFKKNMHLTERFYTKDDIKTLLEQAWKEYSADSRELRCPWCSLVYVYRSANR